MKQLIVLLAVGLAILSLPKLYPSDRSVERWADFRIQGVDVSRYQADIDWASVADAGIDFAFIKATEGQSHIDPKFAPNWLDTRRAGLRRGAYHFFRPEVAAHEQAKHFFSTVQLVPGDLPPVLDVEVIGKLSAEQLVAAVAEWLELAELHYGVRPILYSGQKFYNRYLAGRFDDYSLWMARYSDREPKAACGRDFQFWQYGDQGQVPGVEGNVDLNVFAGSELDLIELCVQPAVDYVAPEPMAKVK